MSFERKMPRTPRMASAIVGYPMARSSCDVMMLTDAGASSTASVTRDAAVTSSCVVSCRSSLSCTPFSTSITCSTARKPARVTFNR